MVLESNAIGETIQRKYDDNDNLIFEQGPRQDYYKKYVYDFSNRLTGSEEVHVDGTRLVVSNSYDYLGNKVATYNETGAETQICYDDFGRVSFEIYPRIPNERGELVQTSTHKQYDVLGNVTLFVDQRGEITKTEYNVLGKPVSVQYPDKTCEFFEYNLMAH